MSTVRFEIKTSEKMESISKEFISNIQSLGKRHKIDLEFIEIKDKNFKEKKILIKPSFESKELMSKNYVSFHKEYLDKYVDDSNYNLMVMDIK
jgi:hypothetical protein